MALPFLVRPALPPRPTFPALRGCYLSFFCFFNALHPPHPLPLNGCRLGRSHCLCRSCHSPTCLPSPSSLASSISESLVSTESAVAALALPLSLPAWVVATFAAAIFLPPPRWVLPSWPYHLRWGGWLVLGAGRRGPVRKTSPLAVICMPASSSCGWPERGVVARIEQDRSVGNAGGRQIWSSGGSSPPALYFLFSVWCTAWRALR